MQNVLLRDEIFEEWERLRSRGDGRETQKDTKQKSCQLHNISNYKTCPFRMKFNIILCLLKYTPFLRIFFFFVFRCELKKHFVENFNEFSSLRLIKEIKLSSP